MKKTVRIILLTLTLCLFAFLPAMAEEIEMLDISEMNAMANEILGEYGHHEVRILAHVGWYPWDDREVEPPHGWLQLNLDASEAGYSSGSSLTSDVMVIPFEELAEKGFINPTDNANKFEVDLTKVKPWDPDGTIIEGVLVEKEWFMDLMYQILVSWDEFTWLTVDDANLRIKGEGLIYSVGNVPIEGSWPQMQLEVEASGLALPAGVLLEEHFRILEDGSVAVHVDRFDAYVKWAHEVVSSGYINN